MVKRDCIYFYLSQSSITYCNCDRKTPSHKSIYRNCHSCNRSRPSLCLVHGKASKCYFLKRAVWRFRYSVNPTVSPTSPTNVPPLLSKERTNFLTKTEKSLAFQMTINCMAKCIWPQGCHSYFSWQFIIAY